MKLFDLASSVSDKTDAQRCCVPGAWETGAYSTYTGCCRATGAGPACRLRTGHGPRHCHHDPSEIVRLDWLAEPSMAVLPGRGGCSSADCRTTADAQEDWTALTGSAGLPSYTAVSMCISLRTRDNGNSVVSCSMREPPMIVAPKTMEQRSWMCVRLTFSIMFSNV